MKKPSGVQELIAVFEPKKTTAEKVVPRLLTKRSDTCERYFSCESELEKQQNIKRAFSDSPTTTPPPPSESSSSNDYAGSDDFSTHVTSSGKVKLKCGEGDIGTSYKQEAAAPPSPSFFRRCVKQETHTIGQEQDTLLKSEQIITEDIVDRCQISTILRVETNRSDLELLVVGVPQPFGDPKGACIQNSGVDDELIEHQISSDLIEENLETQTADNDPQIQKNNTVGTKTHEEKSLTTETQEEKTVTTEIYEEKTVTTEIHEEKTVTTETEEEKTVTTETQEEKTVTAGTQEEIVNTETQEEIVNTETQEEIVNTETPRGQDIVKAEAQEIVNAETQESVSTETSGQDIVKAEVQASEQTAEDTTQRETAGFVKIQNRTAEGEPDQTRGGKAAPETLEREPETQEVKDFEETREGVIRAREAIDACEFDSATRGEVNKDGDTESTLTNINIVEKIKIGENGVEETTEAESIEEKEIQHEQIDNNKAESLEETAVVETAPTGVETAPTGVETAPIVVETAPTGVEIATTIVEIAPTGVETAPTGVEIAEHNAFVRQLPDLVKDIRRVDSILRTDEGFGETLENQVAQLTAERKVENMFQRNNITQDTSEWALDGMDTKHIGCETRQRRKMLDNTSSSFLKFDNNDDNQKQEEAASAKAATSPDKQRVADGYPPLETAESSTEEDCVVLDRDVGSVEKETSRSSREDVSGIPEETGGVSKGGDVDFSTSSDEQVDRALAGSVIGEQQHTAKFEKITAMVENMPMTPEKGVAMNDKVLNTSPEVPGFLVEIKNDVTSNIVWRADTNPMTAEETLRQTSNGAYIDQTPPPRLRTPDDQFCHPTNQAATLGLEFMTAKSSAPAPAQHREELSSRNETATSPDSGRTFEERKTTSVSLLDPLMYAPSTTVTQTPPRLSAVIHRMVPPSAGGGPPPPEFGVTAEPSPGAVARPVIHTAVGLSGTGGNGDNGIAASSRTPSMMSAEDPEDMWRAGWHSVGPSATETETLSCSPSFVVPRARVSVDEATTLTATETFSPHNTVLTGGDLNILSEVLSGSRRSPVSGKFHLQDRGGAFLSSSSNSSSPSKPGTMNSSPTSGEFKPLTSDLLVDLEQHVGSFVGNTPNSFGNPEYASSYLPVNPSTMPASSWAKGRVDQSYLMFRERSMHAAREEADVPNLEEIPKMTVYIVHKGLKTPVSWAKDTAPHDVREAILCACDAIADSGFLLRELKEVNDDEIDELVRRGELRLGGRLIEVPIEGRVEIYLRGQNFAFEDFGSLKPDLLYALEQGSERPELVKLTGDRWRRLTVQVEPFQHVETQKAIKRLKMGTNLLKHTTYGTPHLRYFQLSPDCQRLVWYSANKSRQDAQLPISMISEIRLGQKTSAFQQYPLPALAALSFSLISDVRRLSLDLTAKDETEFDSLVVGFKALAYWTRGKRISKLTLLGHSRRFKSALAKGNPSFKALADNVSEEDPDLTRLDSVLEIAVHSVEDLYAKQRLLKSRLKSAALRTEELEMSKALLLPSRNTAKVVAERDGKSKEMEFFRFDGSLSGDDETRPSCEKAFIEDELDDKQMEYLKLKELLTIVGECLTTCGKRLREIAPSPLVGGGGVDGNADLCLSPETSTRGEDLLSSSDFAKPLPTSEEDGGDGMTRSHQGPGDQGSIEISRPSEDVLEPETSKSDFKTRIQNTVDSLKNAMTDKFSQIRKETSTTSANTSPARKRSSRPPPVNSPQRVVLRSINQHLWKAEVDIENIEDIISRLSTGEEQTQAIMKKISEVNETVTKEIQKVSEQFRTWIASKTTTTNL